MGVLDGTSVMGVLGGTDFKLKDIVFKLMGDQYRPGEQYKLGEQYLSIAVHTG